MKKGFLFIALAWTVCLSAGTYTVTTTADTGNGTLRQAIQFANSHAGPDTIGFDIPETGMIFNSICWFIEPFSDLPPLTDDGTVIDGATQAARHGDTNPDGPEIYLFGYQGRNGYPVSTGLDIGSSGNVVRNLIVSCFRETGIRILGRQARLNRIEGNFIGTNFSGQDTLESPNGKGVLIFDGPSGNIIGGSSEGQGNVVSGNLDAGVAVSFSDSNRVIGNRVGTVADGTRPLGNGGSGVELYVASANDIGGSGEGEGNLISGNDECGIVLTDASSSNRIAGNRIGTKADGTGSLPNRYGLLLQSGPSRNQIGPGNIISGNAFLGVSLFGAGTAGNTITRNVITENADRGISLGQGANGNAVPPQIVRTEDGVSGTTSANAVVEIFSDPSDEGAIHEGTVTADASGVFSWVGSPAGPMITATATDAAGNTSEFSASVSGMNERDILSGIPGEYFLSESFPNPFNASAMIRFGLPAPGRARLVVLDGMGRQVRTLADGHRPAGEYTIRFDASGMASGVYVVRIEAGVFSASRKIAVMK